ncbi:hypothetical protein [Paenibacillus donghaensis]|uniref:Uncharacterized protein n=1 Tax=Paenibacillus donghaensis TaxID=414771 RepID=A0A2Z2K979_9BACL|nr:hypothetical protein [Paenibacillus donghaensis]ASA21984.1 hypothetical protein B9T62_15080 [Paenibacillus donghaensis]
MTFKKVKRLVRNMSAIIFIFAIVGVIFMISLMIFLAFFDDKVITNAAVMNRLTLILAALSLPGLFIQLISLLTINDKKTFTLEKKCPHCRQLIELKLTED